MSLISVREHFARRSGRHDLVTNFGAGTYTDAGANFFINAGQRYLDQHASFLKAYAWYRKNIVAGVCKLTFQYCQAIKEVWAMNSDGRIKLEKQDLNWLREEYGDSIASMSTDAPLYYSPAVIGLAPEQAALTAVGGVSPYTAQFTYDWEDLTFGNHWQYSGVWIMPPVDSTYTISVLGRWFSKTLDTDTDTTYWTEVHPDILVLASCYALEWFYRNSEGMRDYERALEIRLSDLDKDMVEESIQDLDQMGG